MRLAVMMAALALPVAAAAKTPQPATTPGSATLTAPGQAPPSEFLQRVQPQGGPMVLREGIAPPGSAALNAGPTNATPFSGTPSGTLPFNAYAPHGRSDLAVRALTTPNLGK